MTERSPKEVAEAEFEAARELATKFNREHRSERARIDALQARVRELEARLEIDFCWEYRPTDPKANGKGMVRVEIPPEKRGEWPDGIECRNDTIKGQDENINRLRAALTAERAQREALEAEFAAFKKKVEDQDPGLYGDRGAVGYRGMGARVGDEE